MLKPLPMGDSLARARTALCVAIHKEMRTRIDSEKSIARQPLARVLASCAVPSLTNTPDSLHRARARLAPAGRRELRL